MSYDAVMQIAREHPRWLEAIRACHAEPAGREFAGKWVLQRLNNPPPSLGQLARWGILESVRTRRGGRRAYYRMPDREGVGRALRELGVAKGQ